VGSFRTTPTNATVKFLTVGKRLYLSFQVPDKSIGGSKNFNRFDGLLMSVKDHSQRRARRRRPRSSMCGGTTDPAGPDPQPAGRQPVFAGGSAFAGQPFVCAAHRGPDQWSRTRSPS
jgi:hypothetical protein